jgi:hypothetical protein
VKNIVSVKFVKLYTENIGAKNLATFGFVKNHVLRQILGLKSQHIGPRWLSVLPSFQGIEHDLTLCDVNISIRNTNTIKK